MSEEKSKQNCCCNCYWWEPRSGFCRCNPPTPIPIYDKLDNTQVIAMWPKIPCPQLDYCSKFESAVKKHLLN